MLLTRSTRVVSKDRDLMDGQEQVSYMVMTNTSPTLPWCDAISKYNSIYGSIYELQPDKRLFLQSRESIS